METLDDELSLGLIAWNGGSARNGGEGVAAETMKARRGNDIVVGSEKVFAAVILDRFFLKLEGEKKEVTKFQDIS